MQRFKLGMRKKYHLPMEGIRKGYIHFLSKKAYKRGKGLDLGAEPTVEHLSLVLDSRRSGEIAFSSRSFKRSDQPNNKTEDGSIDSLTFWIYS